MVDEYRAFVAAMRDDLRTLSAEPTADDSHRRRRAARRRQPRRVPRWQTPRRRPRHARRRSRRRTWRSTASSCAEQSALNFLLFIHADRRSKFTPFGVFSDERYHVVDGNDASPRAWPARCRGRSAIGASAGARRASQRRSHRADVRRPAAHRWSAAHDAVVLTLPFTRAARRRARRQPGAAGLEAATPSISWATAPTPR